jgi:hypothetical protein
MSRARGISFSHERVLIERRTAIRPSGGARRDRTDDLLLAKQALSQLSYGPATVGLPTEARGDLHCPPSPRLRRATFSRWRERRLVGLGRFELPTSRLSSARSNQLSYKPEPEVSDQQPAIRNTSHLIAEYRLLTPGLLVREEREMKTAVSRQ